MFIRKRKGQSTAEYAILIGVVVAAVVGMQAWISGNIRAKIRDVAVGAASIDPTIPAGLLTTQVFEPKISSDMTTTRTGGYNVESTVFGGEVTRKYANEVTGRTGNIITPGVVGNEWRTQQ